jgi:hypothetical protein
MTSTMRCHMRMFFIARFHRRARVSSEMKSATPGNIIFATPPRAAPPLQPRAYVGYRTVEVEYIYENFLADRAAIQKLDRPSHNTISIIRRITISNFSDLACALVM